MNHRYLVLATATALLAACATTTDTQQSAEPRSEKTYVTGSRLPARDSDTSGNVQTIQGRENVDSMLKPGPASPGKTGGM